MSDSNRVTAETKTRRAIAKAGKAQHVRRRKRFWGRIIDQLQRHPEIGGRWSFDRDLGEYVREDGLRVRSYARIEISVGGCESFRSVFLLKMPYGRTESIGVYRDGDPRSL